MPLQGTQCTCRRFWDHPPNRPHFFHWLRPQLDPVPCALCPTGVGLRLGPDQRVPSSSAAKAPRTRCPQAPTGSGAEGRSRTHHSNGRVELGNAHPAGRVLAVEALVGDGAAGSTVHRRLRGVRVQVDEFLPWQDDRSPQKGSGRGLSQTRHSKSSRLDRGQEGAMLGRTHGRQACPGGGPGSSHMGVGEGPEVGLLGTTGDHTHQHSR